VISPGRRNFSVPISLGLTALLSLSASASTTRHAHRPWLLVHSRKVRSTAVNKEAVAEPVHESRPEPEVAVAGPPAPQTEGDRIAEQATRYQGTRYKFGGTSKHGIDCSGLVMRVYEDLKMKRLPHASSALYDAGQPVALKDLRPGDLVFFKNTYRHGISHVGVYAGHNKFVHAADHRHGVIMTPLSDPYYQLHYAGARRLY
jgi:cell wall-associated NlpC family hydrolase